MADYGAADQHPGTTLPPLKTSRTRVTSEPLMDLYRAKTQRQSITQAERRRRQLENGWLYNANETYPVFSGFDPMAFVDRLNEKKEEMRKEQKRREKERGRISLPAVKKSRRQQSPKKKKEEEDPEEAERKAQEREKRQEEARQKREDEAERKRQEKEKKEEEKRRKKEEKEEAGRKKREEKEEAERQKREEKEEADRKRKEKEEADAEKRKQEAAERKKKKEEEDAKKKAEKEEEDCRKQKEAERKKEEDAQKKKEKEEAAKKKKEEDAERKRQEDEERKRKKEEEDKERRHKEEEERKEEEEKERKKKEEEETAAAASASEDDRTPKDSGMARSRRNSEKGPRPLENPQFTQGGPKGISEGVDVFECFEGEGLLYRIVAYEGKRKKWWFYNDSDTLTMGISVAFGKNSDIKLLGTARNEEPSEEDLEDPDYDPEAHHVGDEVAPGETIEFVEGRLRGFSCAFTSFERAPPPPEEDAMANSRRNSERGPRPLENPEYKLGGPKGIDDGHVDVYEGFEGEGLLYRIVATNGKRKKWWFYNDSDTLTMGISVAFGKGSDITLLGSAHKAEPTEEDLNDPEYDPDAIHVSDTLPPGKTQPFVEGRIRGFSCMFSATEAQRVVSDGDDDDDAGNSSSGDDNKWQQKRDEELALMKEKTHGGDLTDWYWIITICFKYSISYVDLAFPPTDAAYFRDGIDDSIDTWSWKRPCHVLAESEHSKIGIANGPISARDVHHGYLGDCWINCAVAICAERPELIQKLFLHPNGEAQAKDERSLGIYRVTLNCGGHWKTYAIDDYFPYRRKTQAFAHHKSDPTSLWPALIEKAFARAAGSYSAVVSGDPLHALEDLTGCPTVRYDDRFTDARNGNDAVADELFATFKKESATGALLFVAAPDGTEDTNGEDAYAKLDAKYAGMGLSIAYCYGVLAVVEDDSPADEKDRRLIKIRNPWGDADHKWTGAWCAGDKRWAENASVASKCGVNASSDSFDDDTIVWMRWADVLDTFHGGGACFLRTGHTAYSVEAAFVDGVSSVAFNVYCKNPIDCAVVLQQVPEPGWDPGNADSKYAGAMVTIAKHDKEAEFESASQDDDVLSQSGSESNGPRSPRNKSKRKFLVDRNTAEHFDVESKEFTAVIGRSIGMDYRFEPAETNDAPPYLVYPTPYASTVNKKFVLTLITSGSVGQDGDIDVRLKKISGGAAPLELYDRYDFDLAAEQHDVKCKYQVDKVGVSAEAVTYEGNVL